MVHASLFSGIGGFDLAAEWAGWENVFNCEIDPFCRRVLKYHFPNSVQYDDIKTTDFTVWGGKIDVLTGGFPCQPFSTAGKRKGTADNRYLWPEMLRVIREIRPRWVVGENVLGIVSWYGGLVFEQVHADLEAAGYEVQAFVLPACSVGAPHIRYRTWFVAYRADAGAESMRERENGFRSDRNASNSADNGRRARDGEGREIRERNGLSGEQEGSEIRDEHNRCDCERTITNSYNNGLENCANFRTSGEVSSEKTKCPGIDPTSADGGRWIVTDTYCERRKERDISGQPERTYIAGGGIDEIQDRWSNFPTQSPVRSRDDGFPIPMDGITLPKWRAESIKAYGNAIVPQVAYRIFETINKCEQI